MLAVAMSNKSGGSLIAQRKAIISLKNPFKKWYNINLVWVDTRCARLTFRALLIETPLQKAKPYEHPPPYHRRYHSAKEAEFLVHECAFPP